MTACPALGFAGVLIMPIQAAWVGVHPLFLIFAFVVFGLNGIWIKGSNWQRTTLCSAKVCLCASILRVASGLHVRQRLYTTSNTGDLSACVVCDGKSVCVCVVSHFQFTTGPKDVRRQHAQVFSSCVHPPENHARVLTLYVLFLRTPPVNLEHRWDPHTFVLHSIMPYTLGRLQSSAAVLPVASHLFSPL